jgi:sugar phosphate isomerase/epimerase
MTVEYPERPFARSWWALPSKLLAGFYPGDDQEHAEREKLDALLDCGLTYFVSLMEAGERNYHGQQFKPYAPLLQALATERGFEVECARFPIRDMDVPEEAVMKEILDAIDAAHARGAAVYVHCWGGVGRTGTVMGCWFARHGIAEGDEALEYITRLRSEQHQQVHFMPSPQTDAQRLFVREWHRGR